MKIGKKAVIVTDEQGYPNYMTMFYMEGIEGAGDMKDAPDMFKIGGKVRPAVLISQYVNGVIRGIPVSLPYQRPETRVNFNAAEKVCRMKGAGWHIMTNTEWVYLLNEAHKLGHKIGGNTNFGCNADNPEEKGCSYDGGLTLTGMDPLAWSHDGTAEGVFGLCGNVWEWVSGLRLVKGIIQYIPDNNAAFKSYSKKAPEWTAALHEEKALRLTAENGRVTLKTEGDCKGWNNCHMEGVEIDGIEEVPEIIFRLGILTRDWKERKDGLYIDSDFTEALPLRGSGFYNASNGGAAALYLISTRSNSNSHIGFRSALWLDDWKKINELLTGDAKAAKKSR